MFPIKIAMTVGLPLFSNTPMESRGSFLATCSCSFWGLVFQEWLTMISPQISWGCWPSAASLTWGNMWSWLTCFFSGKPTVNFFLCPISFFKIPGHNTCLLEDREMMNIQFLIQILSLTLINNQEWTCWSTHHLPFIKYHPTLCHQNAINGNQPSIFGAFWWHLWSTWWTAWESHSTCVLFSSIAVPFARNKPPSTRLNHTEPSFFGTFGTKLGPGIISLYTNIWTMPASKWTSSWKQHTFQAKQCWSSRACLPPGMAWQIYEVNQLWTVNLAHPILDSLVIGTSHAIWLGHFNHFQLEKCRSSQTLQWRTLKPAQKGKLFLGGTSPFFDHTAVLSCPALASEIASSWPFGRPKMATQDFCGFGEVLYPNIGLQMSFKWTKHHAVLKVSIRRKNGNQEKKGKNPPNSGFQWISSNHQKTIRSHARRLGFYPGKWTATSSQLLTRWLQTWGMVPRFGTSKTRITVIATNFTILIYINPYFEACWSKCVSLVF